MKTIIGFAGRKRSGKTTICKHLKETKGATIITIADSLKHLCCKLIGFDTIEQLNEAKDNPNFNLILYNEFKINWSNIISLELGINDEKKQELFDILSKYIDKNYSTVRELLQFIGTEVIRHFNPNWHVEKMVENIRNATTDLVVVDDVRFPNEKNAITKLGGYNFFIIRPDLTIEISNHVSEISLGWADYDETRIIINMYDINSMFEAFDYYLESNFQHGSYVPHFAHGAMQLYMENPEFGYNTNNEDIIKTYILPNIDKTGAFVIHTTTQSDTINISKALYNYPPYIYKQYHTFVIWNPFIIENLKQWIKK